VGAKKADSTEATGKKAAGKKEEKKPSAGANSTAEKVAVAAAVLKATSGGTYIRQLVERSRLPPAYQISEIPIISIIRSKEFN
jgi:hypothetical protein